MLTALGLLLLMVVTALFFILRDIRTSAILAEAMEERLEICQEQSYIPPNIEENL